MDAPARRHGHPHADHFGNRRTNGYADMDAPARRHGHPHADHFGNRKTNGYADMDAPARRHGHPNTDHRADPYNGIGRLMPGRIASMAIYPLAGYHFWNQAVKAKAGIRSRLRATVHSSA